MSILVIIINCYTKECDSNLNNLIKNFNDPLFKVSLLKVSDDSKLNNENEHFIQALSFASEQKYDYYLIIKDNNICTTTKLAKRIKSALTIKSDIYFLASYQDACHLYQHTHNKYIKYTLNCAATQAFLITSKLNKLLLEDLTITKKGLDKILKKRIKNNSIKAAVFYPTLITFDVNTATSNEDYKKLNLCMDIKDCNEEKDDTVTMVWIIIFVALILFLALLVPYFRLYYK